MINYSYTYLLMGALFAIVWIILYALRKDTRKEMIIMSLIFAPLGALTDLVNIQDWWRPENILHLKSGIPEGIIAGFFMGGIAAVIYQEVFMKKLRKQKSLGETKNIRLFLSIGIGLILFFGLFLLGLNSLMTTTITLTILALIIWIQRPDLIISSLVTGILFVIISFPIYAILNGLSPGWIDSFYYFQNIPKIMILSVPLDDIIWFFFAGLAIGPVYEYWQAKKLVNKK